MRAAAIQRKWEGLPGWARVSLGAVIFLFVVPWATVPRFPIPWAFILGTWAAWLLWQAFRRPRRKRQALWFNLGIACLTLAGAEVYLDFHPPREGRVLRGGETGYTRPDADLGYAPIPGATCKSSCSVRDVPIYTVTYTIDDKGRRIGPPPRTPESPTVLFFGGSFTFGEGLEDHETFPNRVFELTEGRFTPSNLAFSGYGPHQMLAMLESGRAEALVETTPACAVYLAIPSHAARVVGQVRWDREGPRYRLNPDGTVRRDGQFSIKLGPIERRIHKWSRASNIASLFPRNPVTNERLELMAAVIVAARDRVEAIWPGTPFHVLLWDRPGAASEQTLAALGRRGLEVHRVSDMLPAFAADPDRFTLHPDDRHPSAAAARGIAAWIVREILP